MGKTMLRTAAVLTCTMFLFAGAAMAADVIRIGQLADLTGPTGDVGKPYAEGVQAYKEYSYNFV